MAELRLEDIGAILVGLVLVGIGYAGLRLIYEYRVQIGLFIGALWRRYVAVGDWRAAMERLADERDRVKGYQEGRHSTGGIAVDRIGTEPPIPTSVLPHSDAPDTGTWIPVSEDLSRQELLDILARQKIDNKYVFSGNKLAELFASTPHAVSRNVILEEIARVRRGNEADPPKRPAARLDRPANGW
jgi:hypothetical protein